MKYITTFIKKFLPIELPNPLGRWKIDYCNKKMNQKIDLSNEDHCGPCGQYAISKIKNDFFINTNNVIDKKILK